MATYIITFDDSVKSLDQVSNLLQKSHIQKNTVLSFPEGKSNPDVGNFVFLQHIGLGIADLSESDVKSLQAVPEVLAVEESREFRALGHLVYPTKALPKTSGIAWNMSMIRAEPVWAADRFGTGVKVAVLDTGIAAHVNLQTYGGASFVSGVSSFRDDNGHGTHCAGIIASKGRNDVYGVAFGAHLYAVKVLDQNGSGSTTNIIKGMNWCVENGINVISMSLGGLRGPDAAYIQAIRRCQMANITVVCAAGNSNNGAFPWVNAPANSYQQGDDLASPIAVASIDMSKQVASTSSRGTNGPNWNPVSISAPGVSIYSTHLNNQYAYMSGTSMACPHVSGLAALILETLPAAVSPRIVKALMTISAGGLGTPIPNDPYGYGLIDCTSATGVVTNPVLAELASRAGTATA